MISQTIRALMEQHGYTQTELAARAGISQSVISKVLSGNRNTLYLETAIALADVFQLKDVRDLTRGPDAAIRNQTQ